MLKVTLVNPPQSGRYPQPPVGLATIAAVLEREGYPVTILDAGVLNLTPDEVSPLVFGANVIGITAMTPTINAAMALARRLKRSHPHVPIVMGGPHATLLPEETLSACDDIDVIVRGEGEGTALALLRALEAKQPLDGIPNISYRAEGKITSTASGTAIIDMDSLPFPAYHLLPVKKYRPHPPHGLARPFAAIVTSRGCPYNCAYCSKPVFGSKFRAQSPERVVDEIAYLQRNFDIREIAFYDDIFTLDKERARAISEDIIGRGLKLLWTCEARVNLVDSGLLRQMKRAGCYAVAYGIESASPEILDTLHKDITLEQAEAAVRITQEAGIQAIGYLMLGSPGETPETIRRTIDFSKWLGLDFAQFSLTTPFPATELYDLYMKDRQEALPWESFVYAGADSQMAPVFESDDLSRDDLRQWVRHAYREFYLRPSYIWQRLRRCTSPRELKMSLKGFNMLLRSVLPSG